MLTSRKLPLPRKARQLSQISEDHCPCFGVRYGGGFPYRFVACCQSGNRGCHSPCILALRHYSESFQAQVGIRYTEEQSVSCSTRRSISLPLQPQQDLLEARQISSVGSRASQGFALRILQFNERADAFPCGSASEERSLFLHEFGFVIPMARGQIRKSLIIRHALVFANVSLLLLRVLFVEFVDSALGFRNGALPALLS